MIDETDWNLLLSDDADISAEQWTKRFLLLYYGRMYSSYHHQKTEKLALVEYQYCETYENEK